MRRTLGDHRDGKVSDKAVGKIIKEKTDICLKNLNFYLQKGFLLRSYELKHGNQMFTI